MDKKKIRAEFRKAVFERDQYRCVCCGSPGQDRQGGDGHKRYHKSTSTVLKFLDAHHIISRDLLQNGGYVKQNGITVCDDCHLKAEAYWNGNPVEPGFMPDDLYGKIGSSEESAMIASEILGNKK